MNRVDPQLGLIKFIKIKVMKFIILIHHSSC